ncbi:MAG: class I SAM-dependent methyltransferase [Kiritimatiellia bacterium]|nr:class I SAM-dependent methyltransferase [Kiritimatiellia bacterium]
MAPSTSYRERLYADYQQSLRGSTSLTPSQRAAHEREWKQHYRKHLPENHDARILDIGAGQGRLVSAMRFWGYRNAIGIDASIEQVRVGREAGCEALSFADAFDWLPKHPSEYDCVLALDVLEHIPKHDALAFLDRINSAMVKGGRLVVKTVNSLVIPGYRYGDYTHETAFTASSLEQVLRCSGFDDIEIREYGPKAASIRGAARSIGWFLCKQAIAFVLACMSGSRCGGIYTPALVASCTKAREQPPQNDSEQTPA